MKSDSKANSYVCGTQQHHSGSTTCASPTINVWSPTACLCIPTRNTYGCGKILSPWADHKVRPTIMMWSTTACSMHTGTNTYMGVEQTSTPWADHSQAKQYMCGLQQGAHAYRHEHIYGCVTQHHRRTGPTAKHAPTIHVWSTARPFK